MSEINKSKWFPSPKSNNNESDVAFQKIHNKEFLVSAFDAFPQAVIILDKRRQIVFANKKMLEYTGVFDIHDVLGKRPGELFGCSNALHEAGCGTTEFCKICGFMRIILKSQYLNIEVQETNMTVNTKEGEKSFDLRIWAVPMDIDQERFCVFTLIDISDQKRKEALERTFFHDVLNETTILSLFTSQMKKGLIVNNEESLDEISQYCQRISSMINEQRDLLAAEKGELDIIKEDIPVMAFLNEIKGTYQHLESQKHQKIEINFHSEGVIYSDRVLLNRVVGNLIKNAMEASTKEATITIGYKEAEGKSIFYVHNPGFMLEDVKLQIFKRSFSTKGQGHGIGTYSVKLLVERYLGGTVTFSSDPQQGTIFYVSI